MNVRLKRADQNDRPIISNLMQLYLHDFSDFSDVTMNPDGLMHYPYLAHYWSDPDRYPFLILAGDQLCGFILVRRFKRPTDGETISSLAEFFVIRSHRRQGIGATAAQQVLDAFPGAWEIDVMAGNLGAVPFWTHVVDSYSGSDYLCKPKVTAGKTWVHFTFMTPDAP